MSGAPTPATHGRPSASHLSAVTATANGTPIASKWRSPQRTLSDSPLRNLRKSFVSFRPRDRVDSLVIVLHDGPVRVVLADWRVSTLNQPGSFTTSLLSPQISLLVQPLSWRPREPGRSRLPGVRGARP